MARNPSSISSSERRDLRRFLPRLALLAGPFLAAQAAELWLLPLDAFTRRPWEALVVLRAGRLFGLTGPFYPLQRLESTEEGDLVLGSRDARPRPVAWRTDAWGFRNAALPPDSGTLALVGDSLVAGAGLSQDDTLATRLTARGRSAYGYAPAGPGACLADPRWPAGPGRTMVFVQFERELSDLLPLAPDAAAIERTRLTALWSWSPAGRRLLASRFVRASAIWWNRFRKGALRRRVRAVIRSDRRHPVVLGGRYFLSGGEANRSRSGPEVQRAVYVVAGYHAACAREGVRFIFLPVPNKETTHWREFAPAGRPDFLGRVTAELRRRGVEVVAIQDLFEAEASAGRDPFLRDDTHWSPHGVRLAVHRLLGHLNTR